MKKHTIEFIRQEFRKHGYTVLDSEYKGMRSSLQYKCDNHPDKTSRMSYANLIRGTGCRYCKAEKRRLSLDAVKEILTDNDCELISRRYEGNSKPIEYRCLKHYDEIQTSTLNNIQKRQGCPKCRSEKISELVSGENNYGWRGGVHSESQRARRSKEYANWRNQVFKRDRYTCQCCGDHSGGNLEAHHINNFSTNEDERYEVSNGITMCIKCHNPKMRGSFHHTHGTKDNNEEQLIEYLQTKGAYYKGAFSIDKTLKGVLEQWQEA